jgi:CRISPR/Cas system-associated protein endoribonuclease Cas2
MSNKFSPIAASSEIMCNSIFFSVLIWCVIPVKSGEKSGDERKATEESCNHLISQGLIFRIPSPYSKLWKILRIIAKTSQSLRASLASRV